MVPNGVPDGLVQLSRLIEGIHTRVSQQHDLAPVQAKLLCVLAFGPRTMSELAQGFGVEKAALTGLVDRAERRGLVERAAVPGDRRAIHVTLTDAGAKAGQVFHAEVTAALDELVSPLSRKDRSQFGQLLAQIVTAAGPRALHQWNNPEEDE